LLFGCCASVRAGIGRLDDIVRLAGRLVERLVDLRTDGRADFGVAVRGRETVDFGLAVVAFGFAVVAFLAVVFLAAGLRAVVREVLAVFGREAEVDLAVLREAVLLEAVLREAVLREAVLRRAVELRLAVDDFRFAGAFRAVVLAAMGLAVDMDLAATVSAFAAVVMALVAVFMACIADDIVFADDVALVAAAVILVAADVTLVAAEDTVLAAEAGVAELRLDEVRRAEVLRIDRAAVLRDREVVLRDRDAAVLRVDREAGFRVVDVVIMAPAGLAAVLRVVFGLALLVLGLAFGRLAVPRDALRLTDLLRAVLAELRRVAARVVV
jgi:hypothetical protein